MTKTTATNYTGLSTCAATGGNMARTLASQPNRTNHDSVFGPSFRVLPSDYAPASADLHLGGGTDWDQRFAFELGFSFATAAIDLAHAEAWVGPYPDLHARRLEDLRLNYTAREQGLDFVRRGGTQSA